MTKLTRLGGLLVALFVFTAAATADAECAWVLWVEEIFAVTAYLDPADKSSWRLVQATPTHALCEQPQAEVIKNMSKPRQNIEISVAKTIVTYTTRDAKGKPRNDMFQYFCLPDTVDPRGPKEK